MKTPDRIDGDLKEGLRQAIERLMRGRKTRKSPAVFQFDYALIRKPDKVLMFISGDTDSTTRSKALLALLNSLPKNGEAKRNRYP
ncbi:hypothetical protein AB4851_03030 [Burkholderia sp. 22PA0099]|uniref:hypothetical protein n=1 Tax=Burkholderia sp. 22PA0099 TaxID=3237372 RepID=UPI0039C28139